MTRAERVATQAALTEALATARAEAKDARARLKAARAKARAKLEARVPPTDDARAAAELAAAEAVDVVARTEVDVVRAVSRVNLLYQRVRKRRIGEKLDLDAPPG